MKTIFDSNYRKLVGWIAAERRYRKISQTKLNEMLGVNNPNYCSKIENFERRFDLNEFVDICLAIGIDPHEGIDMLLQGKGK